uniref:Uncharacterized protein n=1 Tax=Moniliophthora roreri TaxID=221103 RepID=A0A0W0FNP8_MONRR
MSTIPHLPVKFIIHFKGKELESMCSMESILYFSFIDDPLAGFTSKCSITKE